MPWILNVPHREDLLYIFGIVSKLEREGQFLNIAKSISSKKLKKNLLGASQDYNPLFVSETWTLKDTEGEKKGTFTNVRCIDEESLHTNLSI